MVIPIDRIKEASFWGNQRRSVSLLIVCSLSFSIELLIICNSLAPLSLSSPSLSLVADKCRYLVPNQEEMIKLVDFGCACPLNGIDHKSLHGLLCFPNSLLTFANAYIVMCFPNSLLTFVWTRHRFRGRPKERTYRCLSRHRGIRSPWTDRVSPQNESKAAIYFLFPCSLPPPLTQRVRKESGQLGIWCCDVLCPGGGTLRSWARSEERGREKLRIIFLLY